MANHKRINFLTSYLLLVGFVFGLAAVDVQSAHAVPWSQFAQQAPVITPPDNDEAEEPAPIVPSTPAPVEPTAPEQAESTIPPVPAVPVAPTSPSTPAPVQPQVQPQAETPQAQPAPFSRSDPIVRQAPTVPPSSGSSILTTPPPSLAVPAFPRLPSVNANDTSRMIELSTSAQSIKPRTNIIYESNRLAPAIARDYYQMALAVGAVGLTIYVATYVPARVRFSLRRITNRI